METSWQDAFDSVLESDELGESIIGPMHNGTRIVYRGNPEMDLTPGDEQELYERHIGEDQLEVNRFNQPYLIACNCTICRRRQQLSEEEEEEESDSLQSPVRTIRERVIEDMRERMINIT